MHVITKLLLSLTVVLLTACGGSSNSNSSYEGTVNIGKDTYTCSTEKSFDACTKEKTIEACKANCECTGPTCNVTATEVEACAATTLNELVDGKSCSFGGITYTCTAGTVSGGGFSAGGTISINSFSVKCK